MCKDTVFDYARKKTFQRRLGIHQVLQLWHKLISSRTPAAALFLYKPASFFLPMSNTQTNASSPTMHCHYVNANAIEIEWWRINTLSKRLTTTCTCLEATSIAKKKYWVLATAGHGAEGTTVPGYLKLPKQWPLNRVTHFTEYYLTSPPTMLDTKIMG